MESGTITAAGPFTRTAQNLRVRFDQQVATALGTSKHGTADPAAVDGLMQLQHGKGDADYQKALRIYTEMALERASIVQEHPGALEKTPLPSAERPTSLTPLTDMATETARIQLLHQDTELAVAQQAMSGQGVIFVEHPATNLLAPTRHFPAPPIPEPPPMTWLIAGEKPH